METKKPSWLRRAVSSVRGMLFGSGGGELNDELGQETRRESFSKYFPWGTYDPETKTYTNTDNTVGYLWECTPLTYCTPKETQILEALFRINFPKDAVMQFMLYPDSNLEPFIQRYKDGKVRQDAFIQRNIDEFVEYLRNGINGLPSMHNIPLRDFRVFVTLKAAEPIGRDELSIVEETLSGAGLQPRRMHVSELLSFMRRLFNTHIPPSIDSYDANVPIRKQILYADSAIIVEDSQIRIGTRFARCLTPKSMPKEVAALDTNRLTGGVMGMVDDTEQITTPFLWTLNIIFDDIKTEIHTKASVTMAQRATGSFAVKIQKRVEEFNWALGKLDTDAFTRVVPVLWIFGEDENKVRNGVARARRIWESQGYVMQEETRIAKALLVAALPFGFYNTQNNMRTLDRDFMPPASALARLLPVQADFIGSPRPVLAFVGRKGQMVGLDVFDPRANNHNFIVTAGSGAGKSFSLNYLCSNYYASGAKVRIIDLGYSYKKLARVVGGRFLDFGKEHVCINPFQSNAKDEDDRKFDFLATSNIISEMVNSSGRTAITQTGWTLIKEAVRWAIARDGGEMGVDHVVEYLNTFPKHADKSMSDFINAIDVAREMAFNLRDFRSDGIYGRFFNGKSTFDIRSDDFVVLELDRLKPQKELFSVITLQVLNAVTQDLYWSDRSSKRFILFEEAWSFFDSGDRIGPLIQEGYRRARKYTGSFGVVTQSLLDLKKFGKAGDVIRSNAAFKFYMESSDYPEAAKEGLLDYTGFALDLVCSIKNNKPRYSEMFVDTPFAVGPIRLTVDPWTYWVNTTTGHEVARFEQCLDNGLTVEQALELCSGVKPRNVVQEEAKWALSAA